MLFCSAWPSVCGISLWQKHSTMLLLTGQRVRSIQGKFLLMRFWFFDISNQCLLETSGGSLMFAIQLSIVSQATSHRYLSLVLLFFLSCLFIYFKLEVVNSCCSVWISSLIWHWPACKGLAFVCLPPVRKKQFILLYNPCHLISN